MSRSSSVLPARSLSASRLLLLASLAWLALVALPTSAHAATAPPTCPTGNGMVSAHSYVVSGASGTRTVTTLSGNVQPGDTVTPTVTIAPGCTAVELALASYQAPSANYDRATAPQQRLVDSHTGRYDAGQHTLAAITVPSCFFQVDLFHGDVITQFGPAGTDNYYEDRGGVIDAATGGSGACTPPPCPTSQAAQVTSHTSTVNGTSTTPTMGGTVHSGDTVRVDFNVAAGCANVEVSLVSYTASDDHFTRENAVDQRVFDSQTGTFGPGAHALTVTVPGCDFQVDFVLGGVLTQLGPSNTTNYYGDQGRLLDSANGGTTACAPTTPPGGGTDTPPGGGTDTPPGGTTPPAGTSTPPASTTGTPVAAVAAPNPTAVAGATAAPLLHGAAALSGRPSGCAGTSFSVKVAGTNVATVVFSIDGKRVRTLRSTSRSHTFVLGVHASSYRVGSHTLTAKVTYSKAAGGGTKTMKLGFQRCAHATAVAAATAAPAFTG